MARELLINGLAALAVAGAATAVGTSVASAADLYIPAPEEVAVAVPDDWTGFYAGAHVGYGWGVVEIEDSYEEFDNDIDDIDEYDIAGWLAGVQAGYNYQAGNFAFGLEGDIAWAGITGDSADQDSDILGTDIDWIATLRGRAGFVVDQLFLYGTAGIAAAGITSWTIDDWNDDYFEENGVRYGWVAGLGAEFKVTTDVSVKAEYLWHDFGSEEYEFDGGETAIIDNVTLQTFKVGVNFHF